MELVLKHRLRNNCVQHCKPRNGGWGIGWEGGTYEVGQDEEHFVGQVVAVEVLLGRKGLGRTRGGGWVLGCIRGGVGRSLG